MARADLVLPGTSSKASKHRQVTRSVLLLSDTHIAGPELELNSESSDMDNLSVLRAMQRLYHVLDQQQGTKKLVFVLGDVVHDGLRVLRNPQDPASFERDLFEKTVNGYTITIDLFSQFFPGAQILYTFGNHDSLVTCGSVDRSITNSTLLAAVYRRYFGMDPYGVHDDTESNWSFVRLNSMWGETWDAASARCNTELASFGVEQLLWLEEVLRKREQKGRYVLLLTHFPLTTVVEREETVESEGARSLKELLDEYSGVVKGVLTGHFHKGIDWGRWGTGNGASGSDSSTGGVPVVTVPAVRYSSENHFRLDLRTDGTWKLHEFEKRNKHGARCSLADSVGRHNSRDAGDCGVPLVGHESEMIIDPVISIHEYPDVAVFNPEGSCRWELATPFFAACSTDEVGAVDEDSCCSVLQEAFWPGSSHPFSTCLCMDAFWEAIVEQVFEDREEALIDVLRRCDRRGAFLLWPRRRLHTAAADESYVATLC